MGACVKTYAPFFLVAAVGLVYHILMTPMWGDDVFFSEALNDATMWEYLSHRYLNWISRVVSEFILVSVIQVPALWRIIKFLMFATFPVIFVICGIYLYMQKRKPSSLPLFAALVVITLVSLAVIVLCPGNAGRNAVSIADLPIYAEFGFGEKLYLGLLSIERVFIANADAVFFVVILIWTLLVYLKTNDYRKTLISGLPLLILFGQTVIRTAYPGLSGLFVIPGQILEWSWSELSTWIPMVYLLISVAAMIYAIFQLFGDDLCVRRACICTSLCDSAGCNTVCNL